MNKNLGIILGIIGVVVLIIVATVLPAKEEKYEENLLDIQYDIKGNETSLSYDTNNPVVALYIKKYGSVVMELYPDIAPNTVNNFISLIKKGFYDGNSFHRLMPGFVLQGGDPTGTGSGGPGYNIKGEFTNNGFENNLSHGQWVVSMARATPPDTAGSQFFICLDDASSSLDNSYAAFGKVIDGFDALKAIEEKERIADQKSGKLVTNLTLVKALVDVKGVEYPEPETLPE